MVKKSIKFRIWYSILLLIAGISSPVAAQNDKADSSTVQNFYDLTLEDLMGLEVTVASGQAMTTRESPGIVTLITGDEIKTSGARDLMDILKMVPGLDFGVDVEGVVGLSVRGNWAHEGKALLLIDGLEMNENLYSTLQFGNHYPIENINRIEIIRGPGSAVYGGNAEYAVINIISNKPSELKGGEVQGSYGSMGQYAAGFSAGDQLKNFGYSISFNTGKDIRSDRHYYDVWNNSFDMEDNSDLQSNFLNIGLQYNKLQFRGIIDKYTVHSRDFYDIITSRAYPIKFDTYIAELKQEIKLNSKLIFTPKLNVKVQMPWVYTGEVTNEEIGTFYIKSSRYTGGFTTEWLPSKNINIIGGAEYFYDRALQKEEDFLFLSNGSKALTFNNTAVFSQILWKTHIVDVTAGARYNYNDRYDASFVPRLSVIKVFEKMHFKLLYSEAYRAPGTQNIDLNPAIAPEHTTVIEFEAGVKLFPSVYITGNLYDITTRDPILYYYDNNTDQDGYRNASQTGTKGFEVHMQWKFPKGFINFSYGYYSAAGKNRLVENRVPDVKESLLAIPNHDLTISSSFRAGSNFSINPSLCYSGKRYGVSGMNTADEPEIKQFDPVLLINLTLRVEKIFIKGLSAGVSMFNILDQNESYLQPYTGGHAELPGPSRQMVINIAYKFIKK